MASSKVLDTKRTVVNSISKKLKEATSFIVIDFRGINVHYVTKLRQELKLINSEYKVIKNTILRFIMKKIGFENLIEYLSDTTALVWTNSDDTIEQIRIISKYISEINGNFNIKAGVFDGKILDDKTMITISKLPSKNILISQLAYLLLSPVIRFKLDAQSIINLKENN